MPVGLDIPVRVNSRGGSQLSEGNANDNKVIRLSLGSDDNENAFQQDIGLGVEMVFSSNDSFTRIRILARLREIFRRFEGLRRFKLREETLQWEELEGSGELILSFKYANLETDEEREFRRTFLSAQSGVGGGDT